MECLNDLAFLLNRYTIREIEVLTNNSQTKNKKRNSRCWEFYVGLQKGKWKTEDEIAQYFGYTSKAEKGYKRLKENLKARLLNSFFFVDLSSQYENTEFVKRQEATRLLLLSEQLLHLGVSHLFYEITEKALSLAKEIEHTSLILHACSNLRAGYACRPKHIRDYGRVNTLYEYYWQQMQMEVQVQRDFDLLNSKVCSKNTSKAACCSAALERYHQYKTCFSDCEGFKFRIYTYMLGVSAAFTNQQWAFCLSICDEALDSAELKQLQKSKPFISTFINHKSACLLMLKQYERSNVCLNEGLEFLEAGKKPWFKNREVATLSYLYSEQYAAAWALVNSSLHHERFKYIPEVDQETWHLYQGYLCLIGRIRQESYGAATEGTNTKFRINRWINNMPLYSQDKRGRNIPLLILQILFLFAEVQSNPLAFDDMCKRIEALRKYASRNLERNDDHFRTNCFVALLQLLPKHAGNPSALRALAGTYLEKLDSQENELMGTAYEIEVVPYQRMWQWITDMAEAFATDKATQLEYA